MYVNVSQVPPLHTLWFNLWGLNAGAFLQCVKGCHQNWEWGKGGIEETKNETI